MYIKYYVLQNGHFIDVLRDQISALSAPDIEAEHCLVESIDGVFHLRPLSGGCCLNGSDLSSSTKLSQGSAAIVCS